MTPSPEDVFEPLGAQRYREYQEYTLRAFTGRLPPKFGETKQLYNWVKNQFMRWDTLNDDKRDLFREVIPTAPSCKIVKSSLQPMLEHSLTLGTGHIWNKQPYFWYILKNNINNLNGYEVKSLNHFYPGWEEKARNTVIPSNISYEDHLRGISALLPEGIVSKVTYDALRAYGPTANTLASNTGTTWSTILNSLGLPSNKSPKNMVKNDFTYEECAEVVVAVFSQVEYVDALHMSYPTFADLVIERKSQFEERGMRHPSITKVKEEIGGWANIVKTYVSHVVGMDVDDDYVASELVHLRLSMAEDFYLKDFPQDQYLTKDGWNAVKPEGIVSFQTAVAYAESLGDFERTADIKAQAKDRAFIHIIKDDPLISASVYKKKYSETGITWSVHAIRTRFGSWEGGKMWAIDQEFTGEAPESLTRTLTDNSTPTKRRILGSTLSATQGYPALLEAPNEAIKRPYHGRLAKRRNLGLY